MTEFKGNLFIILILVDIRALFYRGCPKWIKTKKGWFK